jgi:hypothetical protein
LLLQKGRPTFVSSEVTDKGDVSITFDQDMADPTGTHGQFTVMVDGDEVVVDSVVKTNTLKKIKLVLSKKIVGGQSVTVAYAKSDDPEKQIKSSEGGILESFSPMEVLNNLPLSPTLNADITNNEVGQAVNITFNDNEEWRDAILTDGVTVDGTAVDVGQYTIEAGNINIAAGVFAAAGEYTIVVKANGYPILL